MTKKELRKIRRTELMGNVIKITTLAEARRNKEMSTSETVCSFLFEKGHGK